MRVHIILVMLSLGAPVCISHMQHMSVGTCHIQALVAATIGCCTRQCWCERETLTITCTKQHDTVMSGATKKYRVL